MIQINGFEVTVEGDDPELNAEVEKVFEHNKAYIADTHRKMMRDMILYGYTSVAVNKDTHHG